MEWAVFLLAVISLGAVAMLQYHRAAAGPPLSTQSVAVMGLLATGVAITALVLVIALRSRVTESVDDAIGLLF
jgi:multisubunit Na+/H+ antiporter MnhF subunit